MPYLSLECGDLTAEQKIELIEKLTDVASGITKIPSEFFMVSIKELPDESIGIGGKAISRIKSEYQKCELK